MKLKHRMLLVPVVFMVVVFVLAVYQNNALLFGIEDDDIKPSIRDFTLSPKQRLGLGAGQLGDTNGNPGSVQLDKNKALETLNVLKSHLAFPRKDLDISNYSNTNNSDPAQLSNQQIVQTLQVLKSAILQDPVIQDNADAIIELAHILEKSRPIQAAAPKGDLTGEVIDGRGEAANDRPSGGVQRDRAGAPPAGDTLFETSNDEREPDADGMVNEGRRAEEGNVVRNTRHFEFASVSPVRPTPIQIAPAFRSFDGLLPEDHVMLKFELPIEIVTELEREMRADRQVASFMRPSYGRKLNIHSSRSEKSLEAWELFQNHITQHRLYDPSDPAVTHMMRSLAHDPLENYYQDERGTQMKLVYYLSTRQQAMFKPMRYPREQETLPDHFYFSDFERHNAEIAAFHLDKVLGFHRVPPTVGRRFNVTYDVKRLAKPALLKTFFVSPVGNICFHGECDYYCDTGHAVCGHPEIMEGSMQAYLPSSRRTLGKRKTWKHPWKRSYHKRNKADWETDNRYCASVRQTPPYDSGRFLLDLMDLAAFDFLTGNMDRHHYETFLTYGNDTYPVLMDNGRAFGKSRHDELSILAPIYQCCLMRFTTLQKLLNFHKGPVHLSDALRSSMASDVAQPVLLDAHFVALDRRVKIILKTVHKCIERNGYDKVVYNDGY